MNKNMLMFDDHVLDKRRKTETKLTNGEKLLQVFPYIKVYRFESWVHCYYMDDRYFAVLRKWFDEPIDESEEQA